MSQAKGLIISAGAAVVGGLIGGSTGAAIGWTLGSALTAGRQDPRQPTIGDLTIQTSQYGENIPIIVGTAKVAGRIFWGSEKRKYEIEESAGKGSGPGVVTYGYKTDLAILLCAGPIVGIRKVWSDAQLIVDASVDAKPLIGDLYLGTNSQTPDPTYSAAVGAANAPAYRGLAYIVLKDFDLGVSGRVPQFTFEVIGRDGVV